jgi:hypothetical protein
MRLSRLTVWCVLLGLTVAACKPEGNDDAPPPSPSPPQPVTALVWGADSLPANPDSAFVHTCPLGQAWHAEAAVRLGGQWRALGLVGVQPPTLGRPTSLGQGVVGYAYQGPDYLALQQGTFTLEARTDTTYTLRLDAQVRLRPDSVVAVRAWWVATRIATPLQTPGGPQRAHWQQHGSPWAHDTALTYRSSPVWASLVRPPLGAPQDVPSLALAWEGQAPVQPPTAVALPLSSALNVLAQHASSPQQATTLTRGLLCLFPQPGTPVRLHAALVFPAENRLGRPTPFAQAWLWGLEL